LGTIGKGLYVSNDSGATWSNVQGLSGAKINQITIDPTNPDRMYAADWTGLYRSSDGGRSWSPLGDGDQLYDAYLVQIDAADPATLYVHANDSILRSADYGTTWTVVTPDTRKLGIVVNDMVADPKQGGRLYL